MIDQERGRGRGMHKYIGWLHMYIAYIYKECVHSIVQVICNVICNLRSLWRVMNTNAHHKEF